MNTSRMRLMLVGVIFVLAITSFYNPIKSTFTPCPSNLSSCSSSTTISISTPSSSPISGGCTYLFSKTSTGYISQLCATGAIAFQDTTPVTVVQKTFNAMSSGGQFTIGSGTFSFPSGVSLSSSGVSIVGVGLSTIWQLSPNAPYGTVLLTVNANNIAISNMQFDGNTIGNSMAISTGTMGQTLGNNLLQNLQISNVLITNFRSNVGALTVQGYYGVTVSNIEVSYNLAGIYFGNLAYWTLTNAYVHNNLSGGFDTNAGNGQVTGGTFANNTNHGIIVAGPPYITVITITGVHSFWNGLNGINIQNAGVILTNSYIYDNGLTRTAANADRAGIQLTNSASGSQITNNQSRGLVGNSQTYGIIETNGATGNSVTNNIFSGNSIQPWNLSPGTTQSGNTP